MVGLLQLVLRVALLGVNEIAKFFGVLDKEHWGVVPDQVPVAVLGVELHRKATRVTLCVSAAFFTAHGGEAHEHPRLLADLTEELGPGVGRDVVRHRKRAVSAGPLACTTRSGMRSRLKCAMISCKM